MTNDPSDAGCHFYELFFERSQESINKEGTPVLTELFPAPVGPITLYNTFKMDGNSLSGGPYATMASFVDKSSTGTCVTRDLKKMLMEEAIRSEVDAFT